MRDPNPKVDGKSIKILQKAGMIVNVDCYEKKRSGNECLSFYYKRLSFCYIENRCDVG